MDLFVGPAAGTSVAYETFRDLITELCTKGIVAMPCALLEGDINPASPLGMSNVAQGSFQSSARYGTVNVRFKGESLSELEKALQKSPFGEADLCIWFDGLNWKNDAVRASLQKNGYANGDVVLYALAGPRKVTVINAYDGTWSEHQFTHYFAITGKGGPESVNNTILKPILQRCFGANLLEVCSYT